MRFIRLSPIFAGVAGLAALCANTPHAEMAQPLSRIVATDKMKAEIGAKPMDYFARHSNGIDLVFLNAQSFSERRGPVTADRVRAHLKKKGIDLLPASERYITDLADALNDNHMAAVKIVDPETKTTQVCLVSTGQMNRTVRAHISELSSIPESLIEAPGGTARQWQTAKLMHEFFHCLQGNEKRTMFDLALTTGVELGADQKMYKALEAIDPSAQDFLRAYRAARAIASVHFTSVTHHTAAGLYLQSEIKSDQITTADIIFEKSIPLKQAIAERISKFTDRNDLMVKAVGRQIAFEKQWGYKNPTEKKYPELRRDALHLSPADFTARYQADNAHFVQGVQGHLYDLLKKDPNQDSAFLTFYQAVKSLIRDEAFPENAYEMRFLRLYRDGIDRFMPSVAKRADSLDLKSRDAQVTRVSLNYKF